MTKFNPMQDVPINDEQAMAALRHERPASIADSLCGIYRCERATDATILEAFKIALLAHIAAYINAQQTCDGPIDKSAKQTWWAGYEYVDGGLKWNYPQENGFIL